MSYHIRLGQDTLFEIVNDSDSVDLQLKGSLTILNDLTVSGTTTTINTETLVVEDPLIVAGSQNTLDNTDLGLLMVRNAGNVALIWDESEDEFALVTTSDDGSVAGDLTVTGYAPLNTSGIKTDSITLLPALTTLDSILTNAFRVSASEITASSADDIGISFYQELNDPSAPSGTDQYTALNFDITETDITGWDTVNLVNLQVNGTDVFTVDHNGNITESGNIALQGKHTMYVPAKAASPTPTNGASDPGLIELTPGQPCLRVLDFIKANDTYAQFEVAFPKSWDNGTVTFKVFWTVGSAVVTGTAWALQAVAVSDDDPIDVPYGTPVVVVDNALGAANDVFVSSESAPMTIAGTPADDDVCYFQIYRDVDDLGDDMVEDARLIGVKVFFTTNAGNDE